MKKAVLVVSFGTTYEETRKKTIEVCEKKISLALSDYDFYRAYTSNRIIKKIKNRDGIEINNPLQVLEKLYEEGYKEVIVQPLHIICGEEYNKLKYEVEKYRYKFKRIILGSPLLTCEDDYKEFVEAIINQIPKLCYDEAILFVGHGTLHESNLVYKDVENMLRDYGINAYIVTLEGDKNIHHVIKNLKSENIQTINLMLMMLVVGYHVGKDIKGDKESSLKSILEKEGFKLNMNLKGLGENAKIQDKFVRHAYSCIEK